MPITKNKTKGYNAQMPRNAIKDTLAKNAGSKIKRSEHVDVLA
jgi:hypothetical protein